MAIQEIPKAFLYICDGCGAEHLQKNASGHYTNSTPAHWATLILRQDAYDFQGCAVADGTITRLLCEECTSKATKAINSALVK